MTAPADITHAAYMLRNAARIFAVRADGIAARSSPRDNRAEDIADLRTLAADYLATAESIDPKETP